MGNVAVHVLHAATVPVLVIRVKITTDGAGARCDAACADFTKAILYATDFSDTAELRLLLSWEDRRERGQAGDDAARAGQSTDCRTP